jgi:uncharacterized oxidoreductase
MKLEGNTILITGGGSGIGRGLAEAFYQRGNTVIIGGRRQAVLAETAAANPGMETIVLDTTSDASIQSAAAELLAKFPALNVVINNAGVQRVHNFATDKPFDEQGAEAEIETNIYGVLRVTNAFLPHLKQQPAAVIVNVTSGLAFVPMARFPVYCATKAFVHSFTMSLRRQLQHSSVQVVELAPPWVATDLDANHEKPTVHEGMSPMPLSEFTAAAMQELATESDELKVAGAKYLYSGGIGSRLYEVFEQINH